MGPYGLDLFILYSRGKSASTSRIRDREDPRVGPNERSVKNSVLLTGTETWSSIQKTVTFEKAVQPVSLSSKIQNRKLKIQDADSLCLETLYFYGGILWLSTSLPDESGVVYLNWSWPLPLHFLLIPYRLIRS
jgi:hypothetical protein